MAGESEGGGRGEHQENPKDKEGEILENQPSHSAVSQKTVEINKELSSSLVTSSQKDATIKNSPQPGTQEKRGRDTNSPVKAFERKKKKVKVTKSTSAHTSQSKITDFVAGTSQTQFDVAPINVESQPPSSCTKTSTIFDLTIYHTQSPTSSVDVELIHTTQTDSSSLTIMEEPYSEPDHHLGDLLDQVPSFVTLEMNSVASNLKSISTDSFILASTIFNGYNSSVDKCLSFDVCASQQSSIESSNRPFNGCIFNGYLSSIDRFHKSYIHFYI